MDLVEGRYCSVKDQKFVDYLAKTGMPKDQAEKMKGTHWSVSVEKSDGRWVGNISCEEMPELNQVDSFVEGQEKDVDHPMFGGKAKMNFSASGPNAFKVKCTSETLGVIEWTEQYCEDGVTFDFHHRSSGATLKEFWCRKVPKSGVWFEMCKEEGLAAYAKAASWPEGLNPLTEGFRVRFDMCGTDRCTMTELFGKNELVTRIRLDEETDYDKGGPMEARVVATKTGNYTSKWIFKSNRGQEIWDLKFGRKGLFYTGTHQPSGQTVKIWARPVCHVFGKYRMLTSSNFIEYLTALGIPADASAKMSQEHDARLEMINAGHGWVRAVYHSKYMPMDVSFKFGEEYEYVMAMPGGASERFKCLDVMNGNTAMSVWKGSKWSVTAEVKFTGDFAIQTYRILGTDIACKQIMERC